MSDEKTDGVCRYQIGWLDLWGGGATVGLVLLGTPHDGPTALGHAFVSVVCGILWGITLGSQAFMRWGNPQYMRNGDHHVG
jgi:hypothetical protein